jgi:CheY-like chemotaxis protein
MAVEHITITQSSKELAQLAADEQDPTVARRLVGLRLFRVLSLKGDADPVPQVASALRLSESAVRRWLADYRDHGLEHLLSNGRADTPSVEKTLTPESEPAMTEAPSSLASRIDLDRILGSVSDSEDALRAWRGRNQYMSQLQDDWPTRKDLGIGASRSESDRSPVKRRAAESAAASRVRPLSDAVEQAADAPGVDAGSRRTDASGHVTDSGGASLQHTDHGELTSASAVQDREPQPQSRPESTPANESTSLSGARILVAETDEMIRSVMRHRIQKHGAVVVEASDGMEVVGIAQATQFDLAVISATLPGLDGFEVISWLRESDHGAYVPVMMTAWPGEASDMSRAFETGADDFLRKPFSPAEMIARLKRLLSKPGPRGGNGDSS